MTRCTESSYSRSGTSAVIHDERELVQRLQPAHTHTRANKHQRQHTHTHCYWSFNRPMRVHAGKTRLAHTRHETPTYLARECGVRHHRMALVVRPEYMPLRTRGANGGIPCHGCHTPQLLQRCQTARHGTRDRIHASRQRLLRKGACRRRNNHRASARTLSNASLAATARK